MKNPLTKSAYNPNKTMKTEFKPSFSPTEMETRFAGMKFERWVLPICDFQLDYDALADSDGYWFDDYASHLLDEHDYDDEELCNEMWSLVRYYGGGGEEFGKWYENRSQDSVECPEYEKWCIIQVYGEEHWELYGEDRKEEPYCFKDTTIDTVENDICFCSVGGCVKPTEFEEEQFYDEEKDEIISYEEWKKEETTTTTITTTTEEECSDCNIILDRARDGNIAKDFRCNNCYWEDEEGNNSTKIIKPDYRNIKEDEEDYDKWICDEKENCTGTRHCKGCY